LSSQLVHRLQQALPDHKVSLAPKAQQALPGLKAKSAPRVQQDLLAQPELLVKQPRSHPH
jgi:hypothetical protein